MSAVYRLYHSPRCPNCARFVAAASRLPQLWAQMQVVDVDAVPGAAAHVSAVPTVMTADGATHVGSRAFEWLSQFQAEAELECFQLVGGCRGSLAWSALDDPAGGLGMFSEQFSGFSADD
jgi:hypothetical protein